MKMEVDAVPGYSSQACMYFGILDHWHNHCPIINLCFALEVKGRSTYTHFTQFMKCSAVVFPDLTLCCGMILTKFSIPVIWTAGLDPSGGEVPL